MGRTYAISDVHGMGHLLDQMLEKIAFSEADRLYVLGDLIDRGPDPAGVLDLAMERKNIIALKGNHEDAFVDWYDTVPDKIHNRYYYNTYDFLMDSRRTRERLPEYVELTCKSSLYPTLFKSSLALTNEMENVKIIIMTKINLFLIIIFPLNFFKLLVRNLKFFLLE